MNEETNQPIVEPVGEEQMDSSFVPEKKKHRGFKIFFNTIFTIIILAILGNAILGVINFNQLSNQKEPYLFTTVTEEKKDGKTYRYYPQGLFKIIHEQSDKDEKWTLKPFFLN